MFNARELVLNFVFALEQHPVTAKQVVLVCQLFDIQESATRMALSRLVQDKKLTAARRGIYQLHPEFARRVGKPDRWKTRFESLRDWNNEWVTIAIQSTESHQPDVRKSKQALLRSTHCARLQPNLFMRPHNLEQTLAAYRSAVQQHALEADVFVADSLEDHTVGTLLRHWHPEQLSQQYGACLRSIEQIQDKWSHMGTQKLARACFVAGAQAIKVLAKDPLLPAPLVDSGARAQLVESTIEFDKQSRVLWNTLIQNAS